MRRLLMFLRRAMNHLADTAMRQLTVSQAISVISDCEWINETIITLPFEGDGLNPA